MSGPSGASIGPAIGGLPLRSSLGGTGSLLFFIAPWRKDALRGFFIYYLLFSIYYFPLLEVCLQWMVDFQFVQSIFDRPLGENAENQ